MALLNGDVALVGASASSSAPRDPTEGTRPRVKQLFSFGCCNGYHQYFPTIEATAQGGYGADRTVSPVEVGAGERVMDTALIRLYTDARATLSLVWTAQNCPSPLPRGASDPPASRDTPHSLPFAEDSV